MMVLRSWASMPLYRPAGPSRATSSRKVPAMVCVSSVPAWVRGVQGTDLVMRSGYSITRRSGLRERRGSTQEGWLWGFATSARL